MWTTYDMLTINNQIKLNLMSRVHYNMLNNIYYFQNKSFLSLIMNIFVTIKITMVKMRGKITSYKLKCYLK